ncbi:hypothetical protein ACFL2T_00750 [Elusimicrobiota bacterium]
MVEYIYEQAAIRAGAGLWFSFESRITTPKEYVAATEAFTAYDPGRAPTITSFSTTTPAGGGFQIQATATDGTYGSGLRGAWVGYYSGSTFVTKASDTAISDGQQFTISFTTTDFQGATATMRVIDKAGNEASVDFIIDTVGPESAWVADALGDAFSGDTITKDRCAVFYSSDLASCVRSMYLTGPSGYSRSTVTFAVAESTGRWGANFCWLDDGTYTLLVTDCAGNQSYFSIEASSHTAGLVLDTSTTTVPTSARKTDISEATVKGNSMTFRVKETWTACIPSNEAELCNRITTVIGISTDTGQQPDCACDAGVARRNIVLPPPVPSQQFEIKNMGTGHMKQCSIDVNLGGNYLVLEYFTGLSSGPSGGQAIYGDVTIPQVSGTTWPVTNPDVITVYTPVANLTLSGSTTTSADAETARLRQVLRLSSPKMFQLDEDDLTTEFNSTITIAFDYPDTVDTDTDTLKIYRFEGTQWESDSITSQTVSEVDGQITAIGWSTHTSVYATFFDGVDTSSPTTTLTVEGSTSVFDNTVYLATSAYVVLTATDTLVDGYASGLSTIYYRSSSSDDFAVYSDSVALPMGTYLFEYYSEDYAGNTEVVKTSTFVVTFGDVGKVLLGLGVTGDMLVGYSTSGARFEAEAGGVSDYVMKVSSPDGTVMFAADFVGNTGIGVDSPDVRLEIDGGSEQDDIALQLRSGNSTATVAGTVVRSSQIALGYDGETSMRHIIRTQHHASISSGSRMEFLVWGSSLTTTEVATMTVMALEGSTAEARGAVRIHPVSAPQLDLPLVVSNGVTEGGGVVLCKETVLNSSREKKAGIRYLTEGDDQRALKDIASLRPVSFRYKTQLPDGELVPDSGQPLRRGFIYEDAPVSIRSGHGALGIDERIVNVEMALRAAMRRLESLQERRRQQEAQRER